MTISYMVSKQSITVNFDGQTHTVLVSDTGTFEAVKLALKEGREDDVKVLVNRPAQIEKSSGGAFKVVDGQVMVDGAAVPGELGRQIMDFSNEGLPFQPLVNFFRNLQKNPSMRAVTQLFSFLERNRHPITEDGMFIAYKKVRNDFLDIHSGKFDNSPGKVLSMPRNQVNEDPNQTCSFGLHVANWDYAANKYGSPSDTMLEVEVNPADVVAIPIDYNESKMRCAGYKVRGVVTNPNANKHLVQEPKENDPVSCTPFKEAESEDDCLECGGSGEWEKECHDCDCYSCNSTGYLMETCAYYDGSGLNPDQEESEEVEPDVAIDSYVPMAFHSEVSLKKMSTDRLKSYQKKLETLELSVDGRDLDSLMLTLVSIDSLLINRAANSA